MVIPKRAFDRTQMWADRDGSTGCLVSRYSVGPHGYAQIGWNEGGERVVTLAHRVVWVFLNGPIPSGMTVDHTCKNRRCVEIAHLRLLSNFDNARRTGGRDWPLGECINGHPDSELVIESNGRKRCRLCRNEYQRRYRAKRRSAEGGA